MRIDIVGTNLGGTDTRPFTQGSEEAKRDRGLADSGGGTSDDDPTGAQYSIPFLALIP
ncbi:MAG: hypothetical protein ACP5HZ_03150 [Ferrimicrobium sp.]|uniref:hypothetical protein n=1 Tax=Ferrimicrobium sp. TaxID=2926050 RepID=UPI00261EA5CD|nr:hypothetical protein [Ferrimicrobium sp.]